MKLCASNEKWKLEKIKKGYCVRFYGVPWYKKLFEYLTSYLCLFFAVPIFIKIIPQFLALKIFGIVLLVVCSVAFWGCIKFTTKFNFTVVRLNFTDRYLVMSYTVWFPYETLLFDIEKSRDLYELFIIHPNISLVDQRGNTVTHIVSGEEGEIIKLKIWESDTYEEVERIKQILFEEYEKGQIGKPAEHEYFTRKSHKQKGRLFKRKS